MLSTLLSTSRILISLILSTIKDVTITILFVQMEIEAQMG